MRKTSARLKNPRLFSNFRQVSARSIIETNDRGLVDKAAPFSVATTLTTAEEMYRRTLWNRRERETAVAAARKRLDMERNKCTLQSRDDRMSPDVFNRCRKYDFFIFSDRYALYLKSCAPKNHFYENNTIVQENDECFNCEKMSV